MGMKAVGVYLKTLREHRRLSQAALGRLVGVGSAQIFRIEDGNSEPRATILAAVATVLGADSATVIDLLADTDATPDDGRILAEQLIISHPDDLTARKIRPEIALLASKMTDFQLGKWVAAGERILNEG